MPAVEFAASVPLDERIILTLREGQDWPLVAWSLDNGDKARAIIEIPHDELASSLQGRSTAFANYPLEKLAVELTIEVTPDDLERLEGRHPTAEHFVGDGQKRQHTPELAKRVAADLCDVATRVIEQVRYLYGQFWLKPVSDGGHAGNFVLRADTKWRKAGGSWSRFFPLPRTIAGTITMPRAEAYLELGDFTVVKDAIEKSDGAVDGFALITDARARFHEGHASLAMIQLGTAVEWAAIVFVDRHLRGVIPDDSLEKVKDVQYSRLLSDWVLPLARQKLPDLVKEDWQYIQEIRTLRGIAAHANVTPTELQEIRRRFEPLAKIAARSVARLVGAPAVPKTPGYWFGAWARRGRLPRIRQRRRASRFLHQI